MRFDKFKLRFGRNVSVQKKAAVRGTVMFGMKSFQLFERQRGNIDRIASRIEGIRRSRKSITDNVIGYDVVEARISAFHLIIDDALHCNISRIADFKTVSFLSEGFFRKQGIKNRIAVYGHQIKIIGLNHRRRRVQRFIGEGHRI